MLKDPIIQTTSEQKPIRHAAGTIANQLSADRSNLKLFYRFRPFGPPEPTSPVRPHPVLEELSLVFLGIGIGPGFRLGNGLLLRGQIGGSYHTATLGLSHGFFLGARDIDGYHDADFRMQ